MAAKPVVLISHLHHPWSGPRRPPAPCSWLVSLTQTLIPQSYELRTRRLLNIRSPSNVGHQVPRRVQVCPLPLCDSTALSSCGLIMAPAGIAVLCARGSIGIESEVKFLHRGLCRKRSVFGNEDLRIYKTQSLRDRR